MFPVPDYRDAGRPPAFPFGFVPGRGVRTSLYLPGPLELAAGDPKWLTFTFDPASVTGIAALGSAKQSIAVDTRTLFYAITGCFKTGGGNGADVAEGMLVQIYQTHNGQKAVWMPKPVHHVNQLGTGQSPYTLLQTQLVEPGDSISVTVKSLATIAGAAPNSNFAQIVLFGVAVSE